jgi:hypothetical protein
MPNTRKVSRRPVSTVRQAVRILKKTYRNKYSVNGHLSKKNAERATRALHRDVSMNINPKYKIKMGSPNSWLFRTRADKYDIEGVDDGTNRAVVKGFKFRRSST